MQQCNTQSQKPPLNDGAGVFQGQSKPGGERIPFKPKPPSKDRNNLLRRTFSNPEGGGSIRLPSLRFGSTMKMPSMKVKSRVLDPIPTASDLESRFESPTIWENPVFDPVDSTPRVQNSGHKKLERSQTAPMTMLKPILKTDPEDLRGKIMARASEKRRQHNSSAYRMIKTGIKSEISETSTGSPIMKVLSNGRKIISRTFQREETSGNSSIQNKCSLPRNDNTVVDLETLGVELECNVLEEEEFAAVSTRKSRDSNELTYLTFAGYRQQESNRI